MGLLLAEVHLDNVWTNTMKTYEIPSNSSNVEKLGQIVGYQYMGTTI